MKKTGLYGYYDTKTKYVVYIGKDSHIYKDNRHKDHTNPGKYDEQVINKVIQNNPDRYTYFRFIEGDYDEEILNELEEDAIRIFKTYKYDYPDRNVFNFRRGGEGFGTKQDNPNWKKEEYTVIKSGIDEGKQQYAIKGRYDKRIKRSINKEKLEELTNKLNNKEITEEEVKNFRLHDTKAQNNPNWRNKNYKTVKSGMQRKKQQYAIKGRYGKVIKHSLNKKKLEELTNKLNNKEITEEEVKNLRLHDTKEISKKAIQARIKYNTWDTSCCGYKKGDMLRDNNKYNPRKCFRYKYKGKQIPIGGFYEFLSPEIISSIVQEEVKKCKHEN